VSPFTTPLLKIYIYGYFNRVQSSRRPAFPATVATGVWHERTSTPSQLGPTWSVGGPPAQPGQVLSLRPVLSFWLSCVEASAHPERHISRFCDRAVDNSPPAPGCSPDRFGVAGPPTRTLAAVHAGEFGSAGGCGFEVAPKRVFLLDGACIPHDLKTGQELDIARRTAAILQGDTIGFVGG
jgi:hypothetical protein